MGRHKKPKDPNAPMKRAYNKKNKETDIPFLESLIDLAPDKPAFSNPIQPEKLDDRGRYVLDEEEKEKILQYWNEGIINLKDLVSKVWPDIPGLDGRGLQSISMKNFLATRNLAPRPAQVYEKKMETHSLSEEDKEFIKNHAGEFKPMKIAQLRWGDEISVGDLRYRLCQEYYDSLDPSLWSAKYSVATRDYTPPKTTSHVLARLRQYRICDWDEKGLNTKEKENIKSIIKYTHTFRFIIEMNSLSRVQERQMCEAAFLRWTYDKSSSTLTEEHLDMFINLSLSMLDSKRMRQELERLVEIRDEQLDSSNADGKPTINLALVQAINELRKEISSREAKQEATIKKLMGDREAQLINAGSTNFNILNLVEIFRQKDKRDKIVKLAEEQNKQLGLEIDKLGSLDAIKFEAFGFNKNELIG